MPRWRPAGWSNFRDSFQNLATGTFSGNEGANYDNYPSSKLLAEFKVSAVGNNAEFAGTGDVMITTKSGTNTLHGSLFEYFQNRALDATIFDSPTKQGKAWNTIGGSLSGPVVIPKLCNGHNKTFFFVDYEGNQKLGTTPQVTSVPTAAMRAGEPEYPKWSNWWCGLRFHSAGRPDNKPTAAVSKQPNTRVAPQPPGPAPATAPTPS